MNKINTTNQNQSTNVLFIPLVRMPLSFHTFKMYKCIDKKLFALS